MKANTLLVREKERLQSICRLSTMGDKKLIIYIPERHRDKVLKLFKDKGLKVTNRGCIRLKGTSLLFEHAIEPAYLQVSNPDGPAIRLVQK